MKTNCLTVLFILCSVFLFSSCKEVNSAKTETSFVENSEEVWVKMLVEIPAGTIKKYEFDKKQKSMKIDSADGKPRLIEYLGYPGNYGMIPNTLLPYDLGGDGDPLDILAIGPPVAQGSIINCKVIGVLKLKDRGEQDDKIIALGENTTLKDVNSLNNLNDLYPGVTSIIETWFLNYKGVGKMKSEGFSSKKEAIEILNKAKENKL